MFWQALRTPVRPRLASTPAGASRGDKRQPKIPIILNLRARSRPPGGAVGQAGQPQSRGGRSPARGAIRAATIMERFSCLPGGPLPPRCGSDTVNAIALLPRIPDQADGLGVGHRGPTANTRDRPRSTSATGGRRLRGPAGEAGFRFPFSSFCPNVLIVGLPRHTSWRRARRTRRARRLRVRPRRDEGRQPGGEFLRRLGVQQFGLRSNWGVPAVKRTNIRQLAGFAQELDDRGGVVRSFAGFASDHRRRTASVSSAHAWGTVTPSAVSL